MSILKISGLTKKFGKLTALDNISIELNEGDIFGFIGPNGAGKTTTIRSILGILKANSGEICVFGKNAWKEAVEIHKRIAYVPGEVSLWPNLTGGEIIDLFVRLRGNNNKSQREELIKTFDLDVTKKCRSYSKGNRQKVALVAALAAEADLYILDEPTSGLDPLMEKIFQQSIRELKEKGKTIFLSSHILSEVEQLCDRVSIIREGKIIETGTLKELRHLTRNQIFIETKKEVVDLEKKDGLHNLSIDGQEYKFQVDSDKIGEIIDYFNSYGIVQLESMPPNLEDLFIHHYQKGEEVVGNG